MRVHMSGWRKYPLLMMVLMVPVLSSCSATRLEGAKDMVVLEWPEGKPIAGAIVVATWEGQESALVEAFSVCYHVETAVTGPDGSFRIPAYMDIHPGIHKKWLSVSVYKAGYVESIDKKKDIYRGSLRTGRFYLEKDSSPRAERMKYLISLFRGTPCASAGSSARNYYRFYKALAHEASALAVTQRDKNFANNISSMAEDAKNGRLP